MQFEDLKVYKIATELASEIQKLSFTLPKGEELRLVDQILRASQSIAANIAEGYGRRRYQKELARFLTYSIGSCDELQAHLNLIRIYHLISEDRYSESMKKSKNLSVRILNFIKTVQSSVDSQAVL